MLRTILIDDEALAVQRLKRLLAPFDDFIDVIGEAYSGADAVEMIDAERPDLIFLDIQMPELNGFEVVERLDELPLIIFVTAYDQHALKAFETNSIDYLLKPVEPARLQQAVDKLRRLHKQASPNTGGLLQQHITALLADVKGAQTQRMQVRTGDRIRFLDIKDICFFRAADKYVEVHTFDSEYLLSEGLAAIESRLPAADFVRIHRAIVINMQHLDEIVRVESGHYRVRMKNKKRTVLPVSRRAKRNLDLS